MSDFTKMFEGFMKQGQELAEQMGSEVSKAQGAWLDQVKDYLPEGVAEQLGDVMGTGLDGKTRALATIAGITAKGAGDTAALTAAIKAALAADASRREITETIMQMAAVGALDGVGKAMPVAVTVFATDG
ncbi:MAG: carboxymuconolactone decarboxylase family protein [Pseudomonadota bacterium]